MCVFLQNSYVKTQFPKVMILKGGAFERLLSPESRALMSDIDALIKGTPDSSLGASVVGARKQALTS